MKELTVNGAIGAAVMKEMDSDERHILMGEDIINPNGAFGAFMGVIGKHSDRCFDMPICEAGFTHFANGAALAGLRPIVDIVFSDFATIASDAIINGAATYRFCTLGKSSVPTVYIMGNGGFGTYGAVGSGCNHSQCMESLFVNTPGLKVVMPYYPEDVLGLLRSSLQDDDPVVFFYHEGSMGVKQNVEDEDIVIPLNNAAKIRKEGSDVTIIALQSMVPVAEEAVAALEAEGISAELIDPRVLIPFDKKTVVDSVRKTGRMIVAHEANTRGSFAGEIIKYVVEDDPTVLKKPVKVIGMQNSPIGSGFAEGLIMPKKEDIIAAAKEMMK